MRYLSFLLLVLSAVAAYGAKTEYRSGTFRPEVRPVPSRFKQFPYHVIIRTSESEVERISGALVTRNYILTAASPLTKWKQSGADLIVSYGAFLLDRGGKKYPEPKRVDVTIPFGEDVIIHEEFRPNYPTVDNIALIRLKNAVNISDYVTTIKLPTVADEFRDWVGTHVQIVGLGTRYRANRLAKATNWYNTTVLSNKACVHHYSTWERNLCTDATVPGSYCAGTMGSPITTAEDDEPELIAIAMEPAGCSAGTAIVHTQVAPYLYWIAMHSNYVEPTVKDNGISFSSEDLNMPNHVPIQTSGEEAVTKETTE